MSRFYDKRIWRNRVRKQALFDGGYQCDRCGVSLIGKGKGSVHHVKAISTAGVLGFEPLNLKPLCRSCHTATHNELKSGRIRSGCDADGYPLSEDHPWYQRDR
jgi:5-methylcytosine-specific restriction endonuclease McrA